MYIAIDMATAISNEGTIPELTYTPTTSVGNIFINVLPKSSDKAEVLAIYELPHPSNDETYDNPDGYVSESVKLILRGEKQNKLTTYELAKRLYNWLKAKENWALYGEGNRRIFKVWPMGIGFMGEDDNGFPEYVIKFNIDLVVT